MDNLLIQKYVNECFSSQISEKKASTLVKEKIDSFGGKLYKYYSFEDPYSLKNLEENKVHFTKPEKFNDPFDSALGFSIDDLIEVFLKDLLKKDTDLNDLEKGNNKEIIEALLLNKKVDNCENNDFIRLFQLFLSKKKFKDFILKVKNGEILTEKQQEKELIEIIREDPEIILEVINLFSNPNIKDTLSNINNEKNIIEILHTLISSNEIIDMFLVNDKTISDGKTNTIIPIALGERRISNKLNKLEKLNGDANGSIAKELTRVKIVLSQIMESIRMKINNLLAISCFSEKANSILMWSHYGNKHTGFCVEYDFNKCDVSFAKSLLFPVIYSEKRANFPFEIIDFRNPKKPTLNEINKYLPSFICALLTKSDIWKYENEWRIIGMQKDLIDGHLLISDMVSKIYLGANISLENETEIRTLINGRVPIVKYKINDEEYKLDIIK